MPRLSTHGDPWTLPDVACAAIGVAIYIGLAAYALGLALTKLA